MTLALTLTLIIGIIIGAGGTIIISRWASQLDDAHHTTPEDLNQ